MMASVPEPAPVKEGVLVTPLLLDNLRTLQQCAQHNGETQDMYHFQELAELVEARDAFGRAKYGQGLMSRDGRNGREDAMQELGDLLQYVKKITLSDNVEMWQRLELCDLMKTAFKVMRTLLKHGE